ncbi:hypothetical protein T10_5699 [Trichinella papuae]|uniref:Uncharacterized protein n=1 Tax=Trichinella papuae TaxID=268474 RepID=A0A0V1N587_9BILA|nr:hypothetical protein T10_5699 [Trichinella papuae]
MMSPLDPTPPLTADQARHDSRLSKKLNNSLQQDRISCSIAMTVKNEYNKKIDKHDYFSFTDISFIIIFY